MSDFSAHHPSTFSLTVTAADSPTGDTVVVGVTGELDRCTAPVLTACLRRLLGSADGAGVVVDLTQTDFIDVAGLNALLAAGRRASESGRPLGLVGCSPQVVRLVHLAQAVDLFTVVAGREQPTGRVQPAPSRAHTDLPCGSSRTPHALDTPATTRRPRPRAADTSIRGEVGSEHG
ncbi:hypothetical protein GCM10009559_24450 [Pseudonocardia zijingensis]|jgi:anti-anti-sigma factor|uniref:STAS domain-containing protein n=1 Tax=Pseudonocardia zijingensis TaxID=153376 RepID=A0ABN1PX73_9PSEU